MAGGTERKEGRQTIFFTPLDPFNSDADEAESIADTTKPRKGKYQIHWRPEQDAVYWIHLTTAEDAGLGFWQTGSDAIITYQFVPKECVRQGCRRKWEKRIVRQTTKSNTQTIMGSYEIQYCEHASGKPRVISRSGTLTRKFQGVAFGRRRKSNSLLMSESTASPTTNFTRTSSTCNESQKKFTNS